MPLRKYVSEIAIPIDKYAVIDPEATLQEAIMSLRRSYCKMEEGICSETGPRTILVIDPSGQLAGIVDFRSLLRVLVPEVAGNVAERLEFLGVSVVFAEAGAEELGEAKEALVARVKNNAQIKVKEIMRKNKARVEADTTLIDALKLIFRKKLLMLPVYENEKLIGVVRDADLFLAVADIVVD
ncbi:MAG: CBS domain-containing protein [Desulfobacteraceae bacterium]|jgi:CBS domain-containing protein|nr:CBS domain-containing protein [Desulfobacteraceae bacterium]